MEKGVNELINESRDKRAKRTGEQEPGDDKGPIQSQGGLRGGIARMLFGKSEGNQPPAAQENIDDKGQLGQSHEPKADSKGVDFSQGALRGSEVHNTGKFKSALGSQLRQTSLNASQRKEIISALGSKRSGGLRPGEAKQALRDLRKSGVIKSDSQVRSVKRKLGL
jgi:hypothetical protein